MASPVNEFLLRYSFGPVLRKPVFYSWPIGIRFDLQSEYHTSDEAYFREVTRRADTLFQATFQPDDDVLIVYEQPRHKRQRIRSSDYLLRQLNITKTDAVFQKIANPYSYGSSKWVRMCLLAKASQIPYHNILAAIGNQDFLRKPVLDGEVYFLNENKGIIFHMYDDRGLDIVASTVETIRPIYIAHNALILDYDRKKIDATFAWQLK